MTEVEKKELAAQIEETKSRLVYQRALYRVHDTDDPDLKRYFEGIIRDYRKSHPEPGKKQEDPRQQLLPGFAKEFNGHGLA